MNKEILMVVDAVSNEKGVDKEIIFEALEAALASATRKRHGEGIDVRVAINRKTGDYDTWRRWKVFADDSTELEFPDSELRLEDALDIIPGSARSAATSKCRWSRSRSAASPRRPPSRSSCRRCARPSARRSSTSTRAASARWCPASSSASIATACSSISAATPKASSPRDQMIPREPVRSQDRIKAYLQDVRSEPRGPQLFLTRTAPEFLIELFKLEVPEVGQGLIKILGAARDPGVRAKIAVKSNDSRIDPVGACVGMRGSRVQAVSNEIAGERVDIIPYDDNPAQFVINAMAPAEVVSIVVDEDSHSMDIAVTEEKLSQAIGRGGQNIRLASELTGWELNVMTRAGRRGEERRRVAHAGRAVQEAARRRRGRGADPGAGRLLDDRGDRLRAGVGADRHRGVRRGHRQGAAQSRARRAADAGDRERGRRSTAPSRPRICSSVDGMDKDLAQMLASQRHRDARGSGRAGDRRSVGNRRHRRRARRRADHGGAQALVRVGAGQQA